MSRRLVTTLSHLLESGSTRRSFLKRTVVTATALSVAPVDYLLRPVSAYAAICGCGARSCDCGSACCDGYTEFCCTINNGVNACPTGSFAGGWWKADGSKYCSGPRYYIDCMASCSNCTSGCSPGAFCAPQCDTTACGCAQGSCSNRRAGCTAFRYGQCHQEIACSGRISCRVATCTPPWVLDTTCTTTTHTDDSTANHNVPCLQTPPPTVAADVVAVRMTAPDSTATHSGIHVLDGSKNYQSFKCETATVLGLTNPTDWAFTRGRVNPNGLPDVVALRRNSLSGFTDVHVLDGSTRYQSFKCETVSVLGPTSATDWKFTSGGAINPNGLPDIVALRMNSASGHTDVHVLDGSTRYQSFKCETVSVLGPTNAAEWKFSSGFTNPNGLTDVVALRMDSGSGHTDVHVLDGSTRYQSFRLEAPSALGLTNATDWAFTSGNASSNKLADVVAVRMKSASLHTDVHVLDAGNSYKSFKTETVSVLGPTSATDWSFPT